TYVLETLEQAKTNLSDYKIQQEKAPKPSNTDHPKRSHEQNWSPPPANTLKISVDAHCNGDGRSGLGWVVRQEDGCCLRATTRMVCARMTTEALGLEVVLHSIDQYNALLEICHFRTKISDGLNSV
ncbi:hypothetical protein L195_g035502, partial [Trifolium pratense]